MNLTGSSGSPANDETNAPDSPAPSESPADAVPPVNPPFIFRGTPEGNALEELYGKLGEQPDPVPPEPQDVHDKELDEEPEQPATARVGRKTFWGVFGKCFGPNLSV